MSDSENLVVALAGCRSFDDAAEVLLRAVLDGCTDCLVPLAPPVPTPTGLTEVPFLSFCMCFSYALKYCVVDEDEDDDSATLGAILDCDVTAVSIETVEAFAGSATRGC